MPTHASVFFFIVVYMYKNNVIEYIRRIKSTGERERVAKAGYENPANYSRLFWTGSTSGICRIPDLISRASIVYLAVCYIWNGNELTNEPRNETESRWQSVPFLHRNPVENLVLNGFLAARLL